MHDNDKSEKCKMHDNERFLTDNNKPFVPCARNFVKRISDTLQIGKQVSLCTRFENL